MNELFNIVILTIGIIILFQNQIIMAKQDQFDAMLQRLDAATTEIADDLKKLREEVADTISADSLAKLDSNISALETMGSEDDQPEEPQDGE